MQETRRHGVISSALRCHRDRSCTISPAQVSPALGSPIDPWQIRWVMGNCSKGKFEGEIDHFGGTSPFDFGITSLGVIGKLVQITRCARVPCTILSSGRSHRVRPTPMTGTQKPRSPPPIPLDETWISRMYFCWTWTCLSHPDLQTKMRSGWGRAC